MELLQYIERGGVIVYILIAMNVIGFTIMLWKSFVFFMAKRDIHRISLQILQNINRSSEHSLAQIESSISVKISSLESGLSTVKQIASIAPLLGLLGTVVGILNAFDSISHLGLGDPTVFSSGISIALITTVAGLVVAIPHYIGYNYFIRNLEKLEVSLEKETLDKLHT